MYDVIIIGMGPAGMSAGVYTTRGGLKTLLLDASYPGGLLNKISVVDNYLGFHSITGNDLRDKMYNHLKELGVEEKLEKVLKVEYESVIKVYTSKNIYETKSLIISSGRKPKKSGLPSEEKYIGKGVSYCALCDAQLYKDKSVVVLGGGDSALEEAIYLSKYVRNVKIITRNEIKAEDKLYNEVLNTPNIEMIENKIVLDIIGNNYVEGIKLEDNSVISCEGVFIYYGYVSDTNYISNLNITDKDGYIIVDNSMKTSKKQVYACGDIIKKDLYQISTAVSDGAIAGTSAIKEVKNNK